MNVVAVVLGGLVVACCVLLALCILLMVRNTVVCRIRLDLIARVSDAAKADIARGDFDWRWRYKAFDEVSYERMLYRFWCHPLSNYDDLRFTKPEGREHPAVAS